MHWGTVWHNFYIIITGTSTLVGALSGILLARMFAIYLTEFISTQLHFILKDTKNLQKGDR